MNNGFRRSTIVKIFYGLVLLAIGIAFAGSALGFWSFDIFFKGWWCVLLMVLAVADMCAHGFREWDVFVFVIGAVLFVKYRFENIGKYITWKLFFAVVIIYIALRIIFSAVVRKPKFSVSHSESGQTYDGISTEKLTFGSRNISYDGKNVNGGNFSVSFGELIIDMRGAAVSDGAVINVSSSFAKAVLRTPADVTVTVKINVAFGEVKNTVADRKGDHSITINAEASFGAVEIY